jgi:anti-sigma-K factor RskA
LTIEPNFGARFAAQLPPQANHAKLSQTKTQSSAPKGFWRQPARLSRFAVALMVLIGLVLFGAALVLGTQMQTLRAAAARPITQAYALENLKLVPLTGTNNGPDGYIYLAPNNPTAMVWLTNMDVLDANHAYQLWLIQNGTRTNGGTFRPGNDGRAILFVNAPEPWSSYQEIGVTIEPVGGSTKPTTPRVLGGKLN